MRINKLICALPQGTCCQLYICAGISPVSLLQYIRQAEAGYFSCGA